MLDVLHFSRSSYKIDIRKIISLKKITYYFMYIVISLTYFFPIFKKIKKEVAKNKRINKVSENSHFGRFYVRNRLNESSFSNKTSFLEDSGYTISDFLSSCSHFQLLLFLPLLHNIWINPHFMSIFFILSLPKFMQNP